MPDNSIVSPDLVITIAPYLIDILGIVMWSVGFTCIVMAVNNEPTGISINKDVMAFGLLFIVAGAIIYLVMHHA